MTYTKNSAVVSVCFALSVEYVDQTSIEESENLF